MDESTWDKGRLHLLLPHLHDHLSPRRLRLIACACVRQLPAAQRRAGAEAIDLAERFADGHASTHQLAAARYGGRFQPGHAAWAVCWAPDQEPAQMLERALAWVTGITVQSELGTGVLAVESSQADLIR